MARVVIRASARADLDRLARFLWENGGEKAAVRALEASVKGIELLEASPRLGRPLGDGSGRRELSIPFGSGAYIVRYMIKDEGTTVILRVWHSRENRRG